MQLAGLAHMGIGDAPKADQMVFLHHCQRTGLDPFAKQVYMIGRAGDVTRQDDQGRTITERGTIYTIQTGVDGYRLIGTRAAARVGDTLEHEQPQWCDEEGEWFNYWPKSKGTPAACRYTIRKNGLAITAVCNYDEYAQYSGRGELTPMWKKMPANQLAVRTECQAWRKAYPADFSGLGLEGDPQHHTVIDAETGGIQGPPPAQRRQPTGRGVAGLEQHLGGPSNSGAKPVIEGEVVGDAPGGGLTEKQHQAIVAGLNALFPPGVAGRGDYVRTAIKADVANLRALTTEQADELLLVIAEHTSCAAEPATAAAEFNE